MEQKIQELTDHVYKEGVERGEEKARQIIAEAEERKRKIISDARGEADAVVSRARTEAEELKRNIESEITLSGRQALNEVKQKITDCVLAEVVDAPVAQSLSEPETVKEYIAAVLQNWKGEGTPSLEAVLPRDRREALEGALRQGAGGLLSKGIRLSFSKKIKGGFTIGPADGSYKLSFTDEDFSEFFKEYLRPRTRAFLFGGH